MPSALLHAPAVTLPLMDVEGMPVVPSWSGNATKTLASCHWRAGWHLK